MRYDTYAAYIHRNNVGQFYISLPKTAINYCVIRPFVCRYWLEIILRISPRSFVAEYSGTQQS